MQYFCDILNHFVLFFEHLFIIEEHVNMSKTKKPQFKNPFDLGDEEEDEIIPIQTTYVSRSNTATVHNPLPFNPYEIQKQPPKNSLKQKPRVKQPEYTPQPVEQPRKQTQTTLYTQQIPTRDSEPKPQKQYELDENGDIPLLEDIGIEPDMIKNRIIMILKLAKPSEQVIEDPDLSGPILIALCFGVLLLLSGKIHFGDIYAIFVVGNLLLYFLFNFMSQVEIIPLYSMMSTVGYALLPMLMLGFLGIFTSMKGTAGILLSLAISGWSSLAASNFVQAMMKQTNSDRKPLLLYPLFLFYVSFAMIIIF